MAATEAATIAKMPAPAAAFLTLTGELVLALLLLLAGFGLAAPRDALVFGAVRDRAVLAAAPLDLGVRAALVRGLAAGLLAGFEAAADFAADAAGLRAAGFAAGFVFALGATAGSLPSVGVSAMHHSPSR
jgi:hypothetical protein